MTEQIKEAFFELLHTSKDWLKSHTIMAGIVFILLIISLSIVNYMIVDFGNFAGIFFIALGLAILDFLPVVGLLIPMGIWATVAMLAFGNITLGVAVIIVCLVISIIKQIIEPFVVGKSMGISPLEEIISALIVFAILGFNPLGLIIGPILYTVIKSIYKKTTGKDLFKKE